MIEIYFNSILYRNKIFYKIGANGSSVRYYGSGGCCTFSYSTYVDFVREGIIKKW